MPKNNLTAKERQRRYESMTRGPEAEALNTDDAERTEREKEIRRRKAELRKKQKEEMKIRKRRRIVLFVMGEMVLFLLLGIVCYGVTILGSYQYEALDPTIYKESVTKAPQKTVPAEPSNENADPGTQEDMPSVSEQTDAQGQIVSVQEVTLPDEPSATGYRNILIMGLDKGENGERYSYDDEGRNADVLIVASVNNDTGEIRLASIMRDLILRYEDGTTPYPYGKANGQFAYAGLSETVSMINRNFGLDIDEYVTINWYSVAELVNTLGGIEMTIPNEEVLWEFNGYLSEVNEITGIWAPQLQAPGTYVMTGTQVVAFCRIRKAGGYMDFGRTNNQREAIAKIFARAKELAKNGEFSVLLKAARQAVSNIKTNLKPPEIIRLLSEIDSYSMSGSIRIPSNYESDTYVGNIYTKYREKDVVVATDFQQEVKDLHQFLFGETDYDPSDFIKMISAQMYNDRKGID